MAASVSLSVTFNRAPVVGVWKLLASLISVCTIDYIVEQIMKVVIEKNVNVNVILI